jgi:hypothetical protein
MSRPALLHSALVIFYVIQRHVDNVQANEILSCIRNGLVLIDRYELVDRVSMDGPTDGLVLLGEVGYT